MDSALAPAFAALGDPTRLALVARLAQVGEADLGTLVADTGLSQPTVSHHVKVLERAGLVSRRRIGTRRPVRIAPARLAEVEDALATLRRTLEASYARLDRLLEEDDP